LHATKQGYKPTTVKIVPECGSPSTLVKPASLIQGDILKYLIANESDRSIWSL
jgi:hypothetical protein